MTESALIVAVPEAEPVVGGVRARLDPSAAWGLPAHVTVLRPFLPPGRIDPSVMAVLIQALGAIQPFEVVFRRVEWSGDTTVWLAPEPDEPFRAMAAAVHDRFPGLPPSAAVGPGLVPHLTVGQGIDPVRLDEVAAAVEPHLPLRASVSVVRVVYGSRDPGSWHTAAEVPLGL